jgi:osmotically-inducible protein OsmY
MGTIRHGTRRLSRSANRLEADTAALGKRFVHLKRASNPNVNDPTLEQRVQSEIFRDQDIPKDRISIAVQEGVVTLRGVVDQPEQVRDLEERAGKVVGVRGVESYLHLPNTPAPNKEDAIRA